MEEFGANVAILSEIGNGATVFSPDSSGNLPILEK
jgi:hypothetical protein